MLSVTCKPIMLSVVMLSVVMPSVVEPNTITMEQHFVLNFNYYNGTTEKVYKVITKVSLM